MKMSVREARANFAALLEAAEKGEHITITKNGKAIAELGPPRADTEQEGFWERNARIRKEMGLDKLAPDSRTDEQWFEAFNDPRLVGESLEKSPEDEPGTP